MIDYKIDEIEERIIAIIDEKRQEIVNIARDIYQHGELGYKEFETANKFATVCKGLGLRTEEGLAITGVKAHLNEEKKDTIRLALIGEFDALRIPSHMYANPVTQAAHCCGHHAQLAGIIGAALALTDGTVKEALDGEVIFFGVPAEEYGEIEYKNTLREEGKIRYGGGKCELIRIGAFDDVDLSIVHHSGFQEIEVGSGTGNGFLSKVITYHGKAAHAAGSPEKGINALNAASLGLTALAYQRETFRDQDVVRVHPIITKGGDLVNVVPDQVVVETLVRASNKEAILDAAKKTDRAFKAGAAALGATCVIETLPGYLPVLAEEANEEVYAAARIAANKGQYKVKKVDTSYHSGGSTDVGDLQHISPVLKFETGGIVGDLHTTEFSVVDEELAYITTAKIFALSAYRLLRDGAKKGKEVVAGYQPRMTKEEYVTYMDSLITTE